MDESKTTRLSLGVFSTSLCVFKCENCSVQDMMKAYPGYHLSLEEVGRFIHYTKLSGYKYTNITIGGGEPLLWKNLIEGTRMIREAKIAKVFAVESTGISAMRSEEDNLDLIGKVLENVDRVRLSLYEVNRKAVESARKRFPTESKTMGLQVVNRIAHRVHPTRRYLGTMPAKCQCPNYFLRGNTIQICGAIDQLISRFGWKRENYSMFFEEIKEGYLDRLEKINRTEQQHCKWCLINRPIFRQMKIERH